MQVHMMLQPTRLLHKLVGHTMLIARLPVSRGISTGEKVNGLEVWWSLLVRVKREQWVRVGACCWRQLRLSLSSCKFLPPSECASLLSLSLDSTESKSK
jgi:hypothetical protein